MTANENLQPTLRQQADQLLQRLSPSERESLMIKCWMSHDARWFMAVAREFGMETANRINKKAIRETGRIEAERLISALKLGPMKTVEDCLLAVETIIGMFGPDLLDYDVSKVGDDACEVHVRRCFAYDNVVSAGIEDEFECGIFARSGGWYDALGVDWEMTPPLGKCVKALGQECIHNFKFKYL